MKKDIKSMVQDKIDPRIMTVAIVMAIIEFEILFFTKRLVKIAGQDAWMSVILGSIILLFTTYFLVTLAMRFPRENFFQYLPTVWGKPLGILITLGYLVFWFVFSVLLLAEFSYANKTLFLSETPVLVPMLALLLAVIPIAAYGLISVIRSFQLLFPFLMVLLIFSIVLGLSKVELEKFLPLLENGPVPVLKGAIYFLGVPQGLIGIILFLTPFLSKPNKALLPAISGISIVICTVFFFMATSIGVLGADYVKIAVWPGIDTLGAIQFPGFPVERYELWLTMPWLIGVFTTTTLMLYLISNGLIQVLNFDLKYRKIAAYLIAALLIAVTYVLPNYAYTLKFREYFTILGLGFLHLIPWLTLIIALLRGKRGQYS